MWIYFVQEPSGEGGARSPGCLARVVAGMHCIGADAAAEAPQPASLGRTLGDEASTAAPHGGPLPRRWRGESVRANNHLREIGLHATCDVPEFLEAAEAEFSPELKRSVGEVLYDGAPPASYEDWLDDLTRTIAVIDAEE